MGAEKTLFPNCLFRQSQMYSCLSATYRNHWWGCLPKRVISKRKLDDGEDSRIVAALAYRAGSSYRRLRYSPGLADMLEKSQVLELIRNLHYIAVISIS